MGIDMNIDTVRFYIMGQYKEYLHNIPIGDSLWHFVSYTY